MSQVRGFVQRAAGYREAGAKIDGLTALADLLWTYDAPYARSLFLDAYAAVQAIPDVNERRPADAPTGSAQASVLRRMVISRLARHDPALAKQLSDAKGGDKDTLTELKSALDVLRADGNVADASELAQRGMRGAASDWSLPLVTFLQELRRKDGPAADKIFLQVVANLRARPTVEANELLKVGTYLFTSPVAVKFLQDRDGVVSFTKVNDLMVVDVSLNRQNISPEVVRAYLVACGDLLARPNADANECRLNRIAMLQLMPKARVISPDLLPLMEAALQRLTASLPPGQPAEVPAKTFDIETDDEALKKAEALADERERDKSLLILTQGAYFAADLPRARLLANKIGDKAVRGKLIALIGHREVANFIKEKKVGQAHEVAASLDPGIERAVAKIAVAGALVRSGNTGGATAELAAALEDLRGLDGDGRAPYLLLKAAAELGGLDRALAMSALADAIKRFETTADAKVSWAEEVKIGDASCQFPLQVENESAILQAAFRRLYGVAPDETLGVVYGMQTEQVQAKGFVAIAGVLLNPTLK